MINSNLLYDCRRMFFAGNIAGAIELLDGASDQEYILEYNQGDVEKPFATFAIAHGCKVYNFNCHTFVVKNPTSKHFQQEDEVTSEY